MWHSLGEAHEANGQKQLALSAFQACLKLEPTHADALRRIKELKGD